MPILEVEVIGEAADSTAKDIAENVAHLLRADTGTVWVRLHTTPKQNYAENGATKPPSPVFVKVQLAELPGPVDLATQAEHLALAIGKACKIDASNVHIIYEPQGVGRVAIGGKILE